MLEACNPEKKFVRLLDMINFTKKEAQDERTN
jgi:hypothetical protein